MPTLSKLADRVLVGAVAVGFLTAMASAGALALDAWGYVSLSTTRPLAAVFFAAMAVKFASGGLDDEPKERSYTLAEHATYGTIVMGLYLFPLGVLYPGTSRLAFITGSVLVFAGAAAHTVVSDTDDSPATGVPDDPTEILDDGES